MPGSTSDSFIFLFDNTAVDPSGSLGSPGPTGPISLIKSLAHQIFAFVYALTMRRMISARIAAAVANWSLSDVVSGFTDSVSQQSRSCARRISLVDPRSLPLDCDGGTINRSSKCNRRTFHESGMVSGNSSLPSETTMLAIAFETLKYSVTKPHNIYHVSVFVDTH